MSSRGKIRAGTIDEMNVASGDWLIVDVGFSATKKSCGYRDVAGQALEVTFSDLIERILNEAKRKTDHPLNLLFEAPLSIAFDEKGNPTARKIEKRGKETRYWYVGLGCSVLVATTHILKKIVDSKPTREIRLFEGMASFKKRDSGHTHRDDVERLYKALKSPNRNAKKVDPNGLRSEKTYRLESAFKVAGMDFDVPPVLNLH